MLTLGGVDVRDLAADFGTPLYVCDEQDVRSRCREYLEAFGPDGRVFYAAKAFCSRAVLRWVSEEGLGVDVCTGGELEVELDGEAVLGVDAHGALPRQPALDQTRDAVHFAGRVGRVPGKHVAGDAGCSLHQPDSRISSVASGRARKRNGTKVVPKPAERCKVAAGRR